MAVLLTKCQYQAAASKSIVRILTEVISMSTRWNYLSYSIMFFDNIVEGEIFSMFLQVINY